MAPGRAESAGCAPAGLMAAGTPAAIAGRSRVRAYHRLDTSFSATLVGCARACDRLWVSASLPYHPQARVPTFARSSRAKRLYRTAIIVTVRSSSRIGGNQPTVRRISVILAHTSLATAPPLSHKRTSKLQMYSNATPNMICAAYICPSIKNYFHSPLGSFGIDQ